MNQTIPLSTIEKLTRSQYSYLFTSKDLTMRKFIFKNQHLSLYPIIETFILKKLKCIAFLICLMGLQFSLISQTGCSTISYSLTSLGPCHYRLNVVNQTGDCYREIRMLLPSGSFLGWSVNSGAGWKGQQNSPTEITLTHTNGLIPVGTTWAIDFNFFIPGELSTTLSILYDNACIGESCFADLPMLACQGGCITGTVYRECNGAKYANQATLKDWTVTLYDLNSNVIDEAITGIDGKYKFCDLQPGKYLIQETVLPGWNANVPLSGGKEISVSAEKTETLNLGNCPECSCDSLYMYVSQDTATSDTAYYTLSVFNKGPYCFPYIEITVDSGQLINWTVLLPGWIVEPIMANKIRLLPPGGYVSAGVISPLSFRIIDGSEHLITASTIYENGAGQKLCKIVISHPFKPIAKSCCPSNTIPGAELVMNGNFNNTNSASLGFTYPNYNYIFPIPASGLIAGQISIADQSTVANNVDWNCPGLSGPSDKFLVVNGHSAGGNYAWRQLVNVTAGVNYVFCAYVNNINIRHAVPIPKVEVLINGNIVSSMSLVGFSGWLKISANWLATTGSVLLEIRTANTTIAGNDFAVDRISFRACSKACVCKSNSTLTMTSNGQNYSYTCGTKPLLILPCPKPNSVSFTGNFGCFDQNDSLCPTIIKWKLTGPNGLITQGSYTSNNPVNTFQQSFPSALFASSGGYTLEMSTLCPGQVDSCYCRFSWIYDCCKCGIFELNIQDSLTGAYHFVGCDSTIIVNGPFTFNGLFFCQGQNCVDASIDWELTGPLGFPLQNGQVVATPQFTISQLSPANFTIPGLYTLQLQANCGGDTCECTIKFCVLPKRPYVRDSSICRTLTSVYIPLYDCPTTCGVSQVQWFVKPCLSSTWPTIPYQISSGPGCSDLLLLPYKYPNEPCLQVYAVITLDGRCCGVTKLITDTATIILCDPVSCIITNNNTAGFCSYGLPAALSVSLTGANCKNKIEWYYMNNLVFTGPGYQPPLLTFLGTANDCYYDHVFTVKVIGVCGTSTCSTSIRIFDDKPSNGSLIMDPFEPQPFCPGEDATLKYANKCSGPPPKWTWYQSTNPVSNGYSVIPMTGTINSIYNTNKLYQTTWFMVESQNGVCPPKQETLKIDVKDQITINNFTAVSDPCAETWVTMMLDFSPSPITGAGCLYSVEWYKDGNLIHTDYISNSPVSYTYNGPGIPGVYYAIITDTCCKQPVKTHPVIINPVCVPVIAGPCFLCENETITLEGVMVLPPNSPCPNTSGCTYEWFKEGPGGTWTSLNDYDNFLTVSSGGTYIFQSTCNNCVKYDKHVVEYCLIIGSEDPKVSPGLNIQFHPNPTSGEITVRIAPQALHDGRIEIMNVDGKLLQREFISSEKTEHTISIKKLKPGLYFMRVFENKLLIWKEIVIKAE